MTLHYIHTTIALLHALSLDCIGATKHIVNVAPNLHKESSVNKLQVQILV